MYKLSHGIGTHQGLSWNCRRAGNRRFIRNLKDLLDDYRPNVLALLEPRISGRAADWICSTIGWRHWYCVEADGFSRGIWIFWRDELMEINAVHEHRQFVHLQVSLKMGPV